MVVIVGWWRAMTMTVVVMVAVVPVTILVIVTLPKAMQVAKRANVVVDDGYDGDSKAKGCGQMWAGLTQEWPDKGKAGSLRI